MTGAEQWLGGAALLGVLAACWNKVRMLSWRVVNLLVVRARVSGYAEQAMGFYCWTEMKRTPFGEKEFGSSGEFVQPLDRYQVVGYEMVGRDAQVFWLGWKPLLICNREVAYDGGGCSTAQTTVTFIRGMFNLDELIITALNKYNAYKHEGDAGNRYRVKKVFGEGSPRRSGQGKIQRNSGDAPAIVEENDALSLPRRYLKWRRDQLGMPRGDNSPFSCLAYPPEVMKVVERCQRWLAGEKWYKEKEISWRLGILLFGVPGSGKTSFVKAVGRLLNLPVISFDLASHGNRGFEMQWEVMLNSTPCIALLEDIDAVFDGRENRLGEEGGGLTFDCLLNCIGGIKDSNGVLVFVTTNRPDCLDEALGKMDEDKGISTRPGRIDVAVELGTMNEECRRRVAQRILEDCPDRIDGIVMQGEGWTAAQFSELCAKTALEHYWSDKGPKVEWSREFSNGDEIRQGTIGEYKRLFHEASNETEGRGASPEVNGSVETYN